MLLLLLVMAIQWIAWYDDYGKEIDDYGPMSDDHFVVLLPLATFVHLHDCDGDET